MLAGLGNYVQERPLPTLYHGSIGAIPMGAATGIGAAGLLALGIGALWFFGVIGSPSKGGGMLDAHVVARKRERMRLAKARVRMRAAKASAKRARRAGKGRRKGRRR